ncbi:MAG: phosphatidylserine decarboxylase [Gammaproteobacteria bacterium]|nr:phosphatidylserine decarboxylase [Gammaproteobacteria bacterium]MDE2345707.1 phosphatidylserine decarboxylase [Gammaproteobacteria bacterium]
MSDNDAKLSDWLKSGLQYLLPQHAISRLIYRIARIQTPAVKNSLIRGFIRRFGVDMNEAATTDYHHYPCFNAFFTRALHPDARPLTTDARGIACPVDGCISQIGVIDRDNILQAKGRTYSVVELLAGDAALAGNFIDGVFATLYLSPRDYHRIHMPLAGGLRNMLYVPGRLFSVNPPTTRVVPRLFARNERVAAVFDTDAGCMAVVLVGALNVGSIETVWAGEITPSRVTALRNCEYQRGAVDLKKGAELGRFNMGSTVILLFEPHRIRWQSRLAAGMHVRMGESMGTML